jgi:hypothetical protein
MSGPPVPYPNPVPGSNAIGSFTIGVSPIGDIAPFNPWVSIISQYANSPILDAMITSFNAAIDQTEDFDNFYDFMWNIATAQGYGLDVWGRIVGVSRTVLVGSGTTTYFGFNEAGGPPAVGFGQAPFYGGGQLTTNFTLLDSDFRTLIYAKAASNICGGGIPAINQILLTLFPNRGACYVVDGLNMTMEYYFDFVLTAAETAIVNQVNLLPTPCGVAATVVSLP